MKTIFALVVLAVIATVNGSDSITRSNVNEGFIIPGDKILFRTDVFKPAVANVIQTEDVVFQGTANTGITHVSAVELPPSWGSATIIRGGVRQNHVTVRFRSARGQGYWYRMSVWGRD